MPDAISPTSVAELNGLTAVVTGSSSGIGRAIALELASAGADCLIHARRNRDDAESVAAAIRSLGRRADLLLADLAEPAEQDRVAAEAWRWRGRVDIWINNAGAGTLTGDGGRWT